MAEQTLDYPDPDRLAAFGRGILDQVEMAEDSPAEPVVPPDWCRIAVFRGPTHYKRSRR
jgi:hypothetical protein